MCELCDNRGALPGRVVVRTAGEQPVSCHVESLPAACRRPLALELSPLRHGLVPPQLSTHSDARAAHEDDLIVMNPRLVVS